MDIYEIRLENLRALAVLAGGRPALAKAIGMSYQLLQNYIGKNPTKKIGDKTARKAETTFSLGHGWMDAMHDLNETTARHNATHNRLVTAAAPSTPTRFISRYKDRLERLPSDRWQRIEGFALGVLEEWESQSVAAKKESA